MTLPSMSRPDFLNLAKHGAVYTIPNVPRLMEKAFRASSIMQKIAAATNDITTFQNILQARPINLSSKQTSLQHNIAG